MEEDNIQQVKSIFKTEKNIICNFYWKKQYVIFNDLFQLYLDNELKKNNPYLKMVGVGTDPF